MLAEFRLVPKAVGGSEKRRARVLSTHPAFSGSSGRSTVSAMMKDVGASVVRAETEENQRARQEIKCLVYVERVEAWGTMTKLARK